MPDSDRSRSKFERSLERSLELMRQEAPEHYVLWRERMARLSVRIRLDDAPAIGVSGEYPWLHYSSISEVEVVVSASELRAILLGRQTMVSAIDAGGLEVRGSLDDVVQLFDALHVWLHGALRCRSFPQLYSDYLTPN